MILFNRTKKALLRENKELRDAISPITNLGVPVSEVKNILIPFANHLKSEIDKEIMRRRTEVSHRSHGGSASSSIGVRR